MASLIGLGAAGLIPAAAGAAVDVPAERASGVARSTADEPAITTFQECLDAVDAQASEQSLDSGYDWVCAPDGAVVAALSAPAAAKADADAAAGRGSEPSEMSVMGDTCTLTTNYSTIVSELEEVYEFCVWWGRKNTAGQILWADYTNISGSIFPQWSEHFIEQRAVGQVHSNAEVNWTTSLFKNEGILPPHEIAFQDKYSYVYDGLYADYDFWLINPSPGQGIYHIRMHRFHIEVPTESFVADVPDAFLGKRFLCNLGDDEYYQCKYPDGEEAPIFP